MRRVFRSLSILGLLSAITLGSVGMASAGSSSSAVTPRIVAATSVSPCPIATNCKVIATLTYNTPVAIAGNVVPDFTVEDATTEQDCAVLAVTTVAPPTPVVQPPPLNALYLTMSCLTRPGDTMLLVYRTSTAASYVYSASDPTVHALSPQAFAWFEGVPAIATAG